jgi:TRAP-type C4-dicarboxylate transport system substrate-binding protein
MNLDSWNKLPEDVQQVMDDLRVEQSEWTGTYMDNHVKAAMEWAKAEQNVEVITLSAEEKAKWDAKLLPLTEKWTADAKSKGFPAEDIVKDIKAFIEK